MKQHLRLLCIFILTLYLGQLQAAQTLSVDDAWARASAPGQQVGVVYMTLTSDSDLTLTTIASPAAENVEIHKMTMKDGVMRMRLVETLAVMADTPLKLEPGGFHLMLFGLKQPLKIGETISITLNLQDKQGALSSLTIPVPVKKSPP